MVVCSHGVPSTLSLPFRSSRLTAALLAGAAAALCAMALLRPNAPRPPEAAMAQLQLRRQRPVGCVRALLRRIGLARAGDTVVRLRAARQTDAAVYHHMLLALRRNWRGAFDVRLEADEALHAVHVELCSTSSTSETAEPALTLCSIPLPDARVYRELPPALPRLLAAHVAGRRLFPSYAEELRFYMPRVEAFRRVGEERLAALLGAVVDANAAAFSTRVLAEFGGARPDGARPPDKTVRAALHEAYFRVVFASPLRRPDASAAAVLRERPLEVWAAARRSRRVCAELYVVDVAAARGDPVLCAARVVDEVLAQAVFVHHDGSLAEFLEALRERFGLTYVPVAPPVAEEGRAEWPHVREFLLDHRLEFCSAMLTTSGSNKLEEVFGSPATVFPFLLCARESVAFVTQVYECIVAEYGPLNFHNFAKYAHDVFVRDRPEIVRHAPRIFRMLNKTRTGVISFEELCGWMARKLSSGVRAKPDAHLLATAMSLRLPLALLMDRRQQWPKLECALASLSDAEEDAY